MLEKSISNFPIHFSFHSNPSHCHITPCVTLDGVEIAIRHPTVGELASYVFITGPLTYMRQLFS